MQGWSDLLTPPNAQTVVHYGETSPLKSMTRIGQENGHLLVVFIEIDWKSEMTMASENVDIGGVLWK